LGRTGTPDSLRGTPILIRIILPLLVILLMHTVVLQAWPRLVLLPPVLVNAYLLYIFARSVLPGQEALITRFRRLSEQPMTEEIRHYTRQLTVLWVAFFTIALLTAVIAALTVEAKTWWWTLNLGFPAAAGLFFLAEHLYRAKYRQHFGPVSVTATLNTLRRPEAWRAATVESH
jgi:uncharacterized membrane protein